MVGLYIAKELCHHEGLELDKYSSITSNNLHKNKVIISLIFNMIFEKNQMCEK